MAPLLVDLPFDIHGLFVEQLEALRNACNIRLLQMRRTNVSLPDLLQLLEEVKITLRELGVRFRGLDSREWRDGEFTFWFSPLDQDEDDQRWYSIGELIAWVYDHTPAFIVLPFDIQSLDIDELEALRAACTIRLLKTRRTDLPLPQLLEKLAEVKETLRGQGKDYAGLDSWQWMDGCIKFWLNPVELDLYKPGWYSIDQLIAWTYDIGDVMIEELVDEEAWGQVTMA